MSVDDPTFPVGSRPILLADYYRVCDGGEVWSCLRVSLHKRGFGPWHVVKPRKPYKSGHIYIDLQIDGKRRVRGVHQLVIEAFSGSPPHGLECCHNDGNPSNNFVSNLRWDTRANNIRDMDNHGTRPCRKGEHAGRAILKDTDIPEIFRLSRGGMSHSQIAKIYGMSKPAIGFVLTRRSWSHVEIPEDLLPRSRQKR